MNLEIYKRLITCLPVRQQSFTTKRSTWHNAESEISWLKEQNEILFNGAENLIISRQDVFDTINLREIILKTIYWGYTAGMRGNNFVNIVNQIDEVEKVFLTLKQKPLLHDKDFIELTKTLKNVKGLGLSTYSKLLYFLNISFNNNPCLILDQRLINVFASSKYNNYLQLCDIRNDNAENKYLEYLNITNQVAN